MTNTQYSRQWENRRKCSDSAYFSRLPDNREASVGRRQSAAYLTARLLRVLLAGTATAAAVLAAVILSVGRGSAVVITAASYAIAAAGLTTVTVLAWRRDRWLLGMNLNRQRGIVRTDEYHIERKSLTAMTVRQTPFLALFDSVRVALHTAADSEEKGCALTVRRSDSRRISRRMMPVGGGYVRRYRARWGDVLLQALSGANFFSGLVWLLPLIVWFSRNIDATFSGRIDKAIQVTGDLLLPDLSPLLSAVILLPAAGWLINVLAVFFSCGAFTLVRTGEQVILNRGLLSHQTITFGRGAVTAVERQKTLLTAVFRRERCRVTIPGCGETELFMPADERTLTIETSAIFPRGAQGAEITCPAPSRLWRWWAAGAAAAVLLTLKLCLEYHDRFVPVLFSMLPVIAVLIWKCAICVMAASRAGVYSFADSVECIGVRGLAVCRLRVMRGCAAQVKLTQNPFQRASGLCSVYIRAAGARRGIWCRHLPLGRCSNLLGRLG